MLVTHIPLPSIFANHKLASMMHDPIALFWTIIAGAVAYAIIGSTIISAVYLIAQAISQ